MHLMGRIWRMVLWVSFQRVLVVSFIPTFYLLQFRGEMLWIAQICSLFERLATDPDLSPLTFRVQGLEARIITPRLCLQSHPYMAFIENWRRMEISYFKTCLYLLELVWVWFTSVENGEQFSGIISLFPHGSSQHGTQATGLGRLQAALPTEPSIPLANKALAFVNFVKCKDDITREYCRDWVPWCIRWLFAFSYFETICPISFVIRNRKIRKSS